jgi:hypothetical protein
MAENISISLSSSSLVCTSLSASPGNNSFELLKLLLSKSPNDQKETFPTFKKIISMYYDEFNHVPTFTMEDYYCAYFALNSHALSCLKEARAGQIGKLSRILDNIDTRQVLEQLEDIDLAKAMLTEYIQQPTKPLSILNADSSFVMQKINPLTTCPKSLRDFMIKKSSEIYLIFFPMPGDNIKSDFSKFFSNWINIAKVKEQLFHACWSLVSQALTVRLKEYLDTVLSDFLQEKLVQFTNTVRNKTPHYVGFFSEELGRLHKRTKEYVNELEAKIKQLRSQSFREQDTKLHATQTLKVLSYEISQLKKIEKFLAPSNDPDKTNLLELNSAEENAEQHHTKGEIIYNIWEETKSSNRAYIIGFMLAVVGIAIIFLCLTNKAANLSFSESGLILELLATGMVVAGLIVIGANYCHNRKLDKEKTSRYQKIDNTYQTVMRANNNSSSTAPDEEKDCVLSINDQVDENTHLLQGKDEKSYSSYSSSSATTQKFFSTSMSSVAIQTTTTTTVLDNNALAVRGIT